MSKYLTVEEMRHFMMDRSAQDNELYRDIAYSDEEILKAMERAARSYNSIPPLVHRVRSNQLPLDTLMFFHATAEQLLISTLSKLRRNDIQYEGGGITTNLVAARIRHFEKEIQEHRDLFRREAYDAKLQRNLNMAYRTI